jgi:hypothetical protein
MLGIPNTALYVIAVLIPIFQEMFTDVQISRCTKEWWTTTGRWSRRSAVASPLPSRLVSYRSFIILKASLLICSKVANFGYGQGDPQQRKVLCALDIGLLQVLHFIKSLLIDLLKSGQFRVMIKEIRNNRK